MICHTSALHAGVDIRKASRWMGHASINATDSTYTHLFNRSADADMDLLAAFATAASNVTQIRGTR